MRKAQRGENLANSELMGQMQEMVTAHNQLARVQVNSNQHVQHACSVAVLIADISKPDMSRCLVLVQLQARKDECI